MLKALAAVVTTGMLGMGVHNALTSPPTVEAASSAITRTQRDIKETATVTNAHAAQVGKVVEDPTRAPALPGELQAFTKGTERLTRLREDLCHDMKAYEETATAKMAAFDEQATQVHDDRTARSLANLRRHTADDVRDRLANAQAVLEQLDNVLAKGSDLQHAAKAVLIASDLHDRGEEIDNQLKQARTDASQYEATTNSLLARLATALAE